MVYCISTHSSSSVDIQSKHLCNYWLRFPPSLLWPLHHFLSLFLHLAADSYPFSIPAPLTSIIRPALAFLLNHANKTEFFSSSQGPLRGTADVPPSVVFLLPFFTYLFVLTRISHGTADSGVKHMQAASPLGAEAATTSPRVNFNVAPGAGTSSRTEVGETKKRDTGKTQKADKPDRHLL